MLNLKPLRHECRIRFGLSLPNSVWADHQARRNHIKERAMPNRTKPEEDFQERGGSMTDLNYSRMRVDFPRWEEGDPIGWISRVERYFRYHKTVDASMVKIAAIHLEGDAI